MMSVRNESKEVQVRFGREVRRLRTAKALSQEDLAEVCGLHRTYIGSVERGERNVSIENIARIAKALGVEISSLFRTEEVCT
jgi:transcriptional regulator with XRE-family HTH domain